jgi:hypothetical protein
LGFELINLGRAFVTGFNVAVCHFGDRFWIDNLLQYLKDSPCVKSIHVGHHFSQSELDSGITQSIDDLNLGNTKIYNMIANESDDKHPSMRHAAMLNHILRNLVIPDSENILILDSDVIPLKSEWLLRITEILESFEVLSAVSHMYPHASHPCLIAFKAHKLSDIRIDAKVDQVWVDGKIQEFRLETASNLAQSLIEKGFKVALTRPETKYKNNWFHYYLDKQLVHVGNQSFYSKSRLRAKNKRRKYSLSMTLKYEVPKCLAMEIRRGKSIEKKSLLFLKLKVTTLFVIKELKLLFN